MRQNYNLHLNWIAMKNYNKYAQQFAKRYELSCNFLDGLFFMLGVGENPYKKCVDKILNRTVAEGMQEDIMQVSNDFKNAIDNHKKPNVFFNTTLRGLTQ